jgi:hypothetical protein
VVTVGAEPVFCYIDGPHYHPFPPPDVPDYKVEKGVAFYVAPIPAAYVRPARVRVVNAEYRPYVSFRPTVEVAPPPEWHGEVWVAGPSVEVHAPGVFVAPPPPRAVVEVHAPGVFVAPPPPPHVAVEVHGPGVFVAPPHPRAVVVAPPGPVFVGGGHVEHRGEWHGGGGGGRGHWDNGRHRGWHK